MAITLSQAARDALTAGHLVHMATVNPDGSPQLSVVWVGLDGDDIVSGHLHVNQKVRNLQRDPRVTLSLLTGGRNPIGLDHYLLIQGTARITEGGAPELLQRLAHVYLGPHVTFPPMDNPPPGVVLRITPERVSGVGDWT